MNKYTQTMNKYTRPRAGRRNLVSASVLRGYKLVTIFDRKLRMHVYSFLRPKMYKN